MPGTESISSYKRYDILCGDID